MLRSLIAHPVAATPTATAVVSVMISMLTIDASEILINYGERRDRRQVRERRLYVVGGGEISVYSCNIS